MPALYWAFENQPIKSGLLAQPSRYKRVENNLPADDKGPKQGDLGSCLVIHLYTINLLD